MEEMEMPTPCQHCGEWFDLQDGKPSEDWYPNTVICEDCSEKEEAEIEENERWEEINNELENALYGLLVEKNVWSKLSDENQKTIIQLALFKP